MKNSCIGDDCLFFTQCDDCLFIACGGCINEGYYFSSDGYFKGKKYCDSCIPKHRDEINKLKKKDEKIYKIKELEKEKNDIEEELKKLNITHE